MGLPAPHVRQEAATINILSLPFLGFCTALFALYWALPVKYKPFALALANLAFAVFFGLPTVAALLYVTLLAFGGARLLARQPRRLWFGLLAAASLLPLAFCKYAPAFTGFLAGLSGGLFPSVGYMAVPIGISYFTFRGLLYLYAAYKGSGSSESLLHTFNYTAFFAMLSSGPIQPPESLMPQLKAPPTFDAELAFTGCGRILWGMAMKVVVADYVAGFQPAFRTLSMTHGLTIAIATLCYTVQLYCDFAGYSQIAIGVGNLLGYRCEENFQSPYLSRSIAEFWRRWHISLSTMLRRLVYIPLGGSRHGTLRWVLAIFATFLLSGLWHGAGYVFLLWGAWHGLCIVVGKLTAPLRQRLHKALHLAEDGLLLRVWQTLFTLVLVAFGWLVFKVGSGWGGTWAGLVYVLQRLFAPAPLSLQYAKEALVLAGFDAGSLVFTGIIVLAVFAMDVLTAKEGFGAWFATRRGATKAIFAALCLVVILFFGQVGGGSFIYFSF